MKTSGVYHRAFLYGSMSPSSCYHTETPYVGCLFFYEKMVRISDPTTNLTDLYELEDVNNDKVEDVNGDIIFYIWPSQVYITERS